MENNGANVNTTVTQSQNAKIGAEERERNDSSIDVAAHTQTHKVGHNFNEMKMLMS